MPDDTYANSMGSVFFGQIENKIQEAIQEPVNGQNICIVREKSPEDDAKHHIFILCIPVLHVQARLRKCIFLHAGKGEHLSSFIALLQYWLIIESFLRSQNIIHNFIFGQKTKEVLDILVSDFLHHKNEINAPLSDTLVIPGLNPDKKLDHHQVTAVKFFQKGFRGVLADEMGLGKMIISLSIIAVHGRFPVIIVAPSNLMLQWQSEVHDFFPLWSVFMAEKTKTTKVPPGYNLILTSYNTLQFWNYELGKCQAQGIIFDEIQFLKNCSTLRFKEAKKIAHPLKLRLGLSGTPVINHPKELFPQLEILGCLHKLQVEWVTTSELDVDHWTQYQQESDSFQEWLRTEFPDGYNDRRIKDFVAANAGGILDMISQMQTIIGKLKIKKAKSMTDILVKKKQSVLIAAYHRSCFDALEKMGCMAICGGMSKTKIEKIKHDFQNSPIPQCIVMSIAMALGHNLTRASQGIHMQLTWTPADLQQSMRRIYHRGQNKPVTYTILLVKESIDMYIWEVIQKKYANIQGLVESDSFPTDDNFKTDTLKHIIKKYLEILMIHFFDLLEYLVLETKKRKMVLIIPCETKNSQLCLRVS
ncbi:P-loop containing nucleoside triphosphate hydrolase protein [Glomus cerebriforme]|uniref:P-loop containing nucleoside triphosphate hydrolase protein n=1 Tax=Glomus cerebriforme TaxID=658196 RepID=A0A397SD13_9GLOM|nr:P-loop containing nucleoside triphosphate hydrolase protein [Glomus cerebriforme]